MRGEEQLLRWAVVDAPAEDTPRLAYADWLQEHDRDPEAQFVRAQVAQAQAGALATDEIRTLWLDRGVQDAYFDAMPAPVATVWTGLPVGHKPSFLVGTTSRPHFTVSRGFVSDVSGRYDDLRPVLGQLFANHPVTSANIFGLLYFDAGSPGYFSFVSDAMYQAHPARYPAGLEEYLVPDDLWDFGAKLHGWPPMRGVDTTKLWDVLNRTVVAFGQFLGRQHRENLV